MSIKNVVFDFGGVLIDWNPRHLYENVFTDKSEMEFFLQNVCSFEWNLKQDAGRPLSEGTEELQRQFPNYKREIDMYYKDWPKMLGGEIFENTRLIKPLKAKYRLFGLSNWSKETYPIAYKKYPIFEQLEGIVLSGQEKKIKPDKDIYNILLKRYHLKASESLFIDDNMANVVAAIEIGFSGIHLGDGIRLEEKLINMGIL